jgi:hypothetical protein
MTASQPLRAGSSLEVKAAGEILSRFSVGWGEPQPTIPASRLE